MIATSLSRLGRANSTASISDLLAFCPHLRQPLTPEEAARAVYIDFEGNQKLPPTLLGVLVAEDGCPASFRQFVFEETFQPAVLAREKDTYRDAAQEIGCTRDNWTYCAAAAALADQCEQEDRWLVAWSSREFVAFAEVLGADNPLLARVGARYRDAKRTAARWKMRRHPGTKFKLTPGRGRHRLANYTDLVGYAVPPHLGDQTAGKRLADVRAQLDKKRDFSALTATAKRKWTNLLHYNFHDCNGMRAVAVTASAGLLATP